MKDEQNIVERFLSTRPKLRDFVIGAALYISAWTYDPRKALKEEERDPESPEDHEPKLGYGVIMPERERNSGSLDHELGVPPSYGSLFERPILEGHELTARPSIGCGINFKFDPYNNDIPLEKRCPYFLDPNGAK
jgi:hypothetical protein